MRLSVLISLLFWLLPLQAGSIIGTWHTVDDETGDVKSIVEIYVEQEEFFGKITKLLLKPSNTVCTKCKGDDKDQPLLGLVIIKNLKKNDDAYTKGTILDPANGKVYRSKVWLEGDKLYVRGYLGIFHRTQIWYRAVDE